MSLFFLGDILGCLIDISNKYVMFYLNGVPLPKPHFEFLTGMPEETGYFAAASFMSFQQCRFNFGHMPFRLIWTSGFVRNITFISLHCKKARVWNFLFIVELNKQVPPTKHRFQNIQRLWLSYKGAKDNPSKVGIIHSFSLLQKVKGFFAFAESKGFL